MITELICRDVVRALHGRQSTLARTFDLANEGLRTNEASSTIEHGAPPARLIRELLAEYSLSDIEAALRWLEYGEYLTYSGYGFAPRMVVHLSTKGVRFAEAGLLTASERDLLYQEDPYACFVARQFRNDDDDLYAHLCENALTPLGITALDGRAEGLDSFRGEIIAKIRRARFFICLLTRRSELVAGTFASSVWLYQETGAAVALGKKPLVLVESGMDDHYAGELQKTYEYVPFARSTFPEAVEETGRRLKADRVANAIPLRALAT